MSLLISELTNIEINQSLHSHKVNDKINANISTGKTADMKFRPDPTLIFAQARNSASFRSSDISAHVPRMLGLNTVFLRQHAHVFPELSTPPEQASSIC